MDMRRVFICKQDSDAYAAGTSTSESDGSESEPGSSDVRRFDDSGSSATSSAGESPWKLNLQRLSTSTSEGAGKIGSFHILNEDVEEDHRLHFRLAIRCAVGVLLLSIPAMVKPGTVSAFDWLLDWGIIAKGQGMTTMYLFTVSKDTSRTIELALAAMLGTFVSIVYSVAAETVYPGGWHEGYPERAFWMLLACGFVFILSLLWLNVNMNTRIFALSSFVWHWMTFMNPMKDEGFGTLLRPKSNGPAGKELRAAVFGCTVAVLTMLIPRKLTALGELRKFSARLVTQLDTTWTHCALFMCGKERDSQLQDKLVMHLCKLNEELLSSRAIISNSWYECLGRGKGQQTRVMLGRLNKILSEDYDRTYSVYISSLEETFGEGHVLFMSRLEDDIEAVNRQAAELLLRSTEAACDGVISDDEEQDLLECIEDTRLACEGLTRKLYQVKRELGIAGISEDLLHEQCFCLNLCAHGRLAVSYAEDLLRHKNGEETLPSVDSIQTALIPCDIDHRVFVLRNLVTICIGMYIGYQGYRAHFRPFDAGIASTTAILLSKFQGSALTKNIHRIQGVVIGDIFGELAWALFGWCNEFNYIVLMSILFGWNLIMMFTYFHHPAYSTTALLLAVFGSKQMSIGCTEEADETRGGNKATYHDIVNTCVALFIAVMVDMVLARKTAPEMASETMLDVWKQIEQAIDDVLNPEVPHTRRRTPELAQRIADMKALNQEAVQHLSFRGKRWPGALFDKAIECCMQLCTHLDSIEYVASAGQDGGLKDPDIMRAFRLKHYEPLRRHILTQMDGLKELLTIFNFRSRKKLLQALLDEGGIPDAWARADFLHFIAETNARTDWERTGSTLEHDGESQVCSLLTAMRALSEANRELKRAMERHLL